MITRLSGGGQDAVSDGEGLRTVLEKYGVEVRSRGNVSCPLHEDVNPSMSVDLRRGVWHCFSCDAGGGWAQLVMRMENVGFKDARVIGSGWGAGGGGGFSGGGGVRGGVSRLSGSGAHGSQGVARLGV